MRYSIGQLARAAGVTIRALHHYDAVGLLRPSARTAAGYRRYSEYDLERLQRIVFYRRLGLGLEQISAIITDAHADPRDHLRRQREALVGRIAQLQRMLTVVEELMVTGGMRDGFSSHAYNESLPEHDVAALPLSQQVYLLGSRDWRVRLAAERALSRGGDEVLKVLVEGLGHPTPGVRRWSAQLLDHLADDRCVPALERLLEDPVPRVRFAAVHALACRRCKAGPFQPTIDVVRRLLEMAFHDVSIRVRREATYALGLQPFDPRAIAGLRRIIAREPDEATRRNARSALRNQVRASAAAG